MTAPIVIAGTTGASTVTPRRFVQFWGMVKVAGIESVMCLASMSDTDSQILGINRDCPSEWFPAVFAAFDKTLAGVPVEPTHTVEWSYGSPVFKVVTVESETP